MKRTSRPMMNTQNLVAVAVVIAAFIVMLPGRYALATVESQIEPVAPASAAPSNAIDVVVVLDDSGSMATCWPWPTGTPPFYPPCGSPSPNEPSDPNDLRYSAARLLVQLADAEDRVAVIRFDTVAEGVGEMGGLQTVGSAENRERLVQSLQPPNDYFRRGYTRMDLGLQMAMDLLEGSREVGRNQYIVLLSDGEPTHPGGPDAIKLDITAQAQELLSDGVMTFPVVLCNPTAGCQGEFLREVFADFGVSEATTAESLLPIFGKALSEMKPDRSVIASQGRGLQLTTRASQAVRRMSYVTERDGLLQLSRDGQPALSRQALDDPNIDINVVDSPDGADGQWAADVADSGGFVVVQADSYPELVSPPPSIASSAASVRYYPAGKTPLLIARGVGPAAGEMLLYNGKQPMQAFGQGDLRFHLPDDESGTVRLQLGEDKSPLQLVRRYRLEPRQGLPLAEVLSPTTANDGRLEDGRMQLQVGFRSGARVQDLAATVYVFETGGAVNAADADGVLVYTTDMVCSERVCSDERFMPADGRNYEITYTVSGEVDDLRFGDWAQTEIGLEPAVYLRGLPETLDLAQMPDEGWPVELTSGTVEEIGMLSADIVLRDVANGEAVQGVSLDFMHDVPEDGSLATVLYVDGLAALRPGDYEGEIVLDAKSPSGRPMDVQLRPAPLIPVRITVPRPVASIRSQELDFGDVLFDTSSNFRLNEEAFVTVDFSHKEFPLSAQLAGNDCPALSVTAGDAIERMGQTVVPLRLSSPEPVQPGTCSGEILLSGPDSDHDVTPNSVKWRVHVSDVEWSLVGGDLNLGDLQDAGTRIEETVQIRFSGKPPFLVELDDLTAAGSNVPSGSPSLLATDYLDMPSVEVNGPPQEDGTYLVPITLVARQAIPSDALRGTFYTGQLALRIAGLDDAPKPVNIAFRSPSLYQRYLAPIVTPVYSMPMVLCTAPLTLLVLLVLVARMRGRGFDQDEVEQAAMATAIKTVAVDTQQALAPEPVGPKVAPAATAAWGGSEWGSVWNAQGGAEQSRAATANGHSNGLPNGRTNGGARGQEADPWSSSW